jgi:hypothetical protein
MISLMVRDLSKIIDELKRVVQYTFTFIRAFASIESAHHMILGNFIKIVEHSSILLHRTNVMNILRKSINILFKFI